MPPPVCPPVPRVLSDATAVMSDPATYPPTLVQLARLLMISAAGRALPQRIRDPQPRLTTPRVQPALRIIHGGRA